MKKVLVSACLLGTNCKYSGGNNRNEKVISFLENREVIPVCPEMQAGLGVPRNPVEIVQGKLEDRQGNSVDALLRGTVSRMVQQLNPQEIDFAVLQSRSPTCGVRQIYDGSFSGKLIPGSGVFARALREAGIRVVDAEELENWKERD